MLTFTLRQCLQPVLLVCRQTATKEIREGTAEVDDGIRSDQDMHDYKIF